MEKAVRLNDGPLFWDLFPGSQGTHAAVLVI